MQDNSFTKKMYGYEMDEEELSVWDAFCAEIKEACGKMELLAESEAERKNHLASRTYANARGYHSGWGYYEVCEGDRGSLCVLFNTVSKEEAKWFCLKSIVCDIGLALELSSRKQTEPLWHYGIQKYDAVLKQWNENPSGWKYDLRYDGRKYWFEFCIKTLSKVYDVNSPQMETLITEYTGLMNRWFYEPHWGFDESIMEFAEVSNSPEHD